METTVAPDLSPGYPSNGAKLGPAWRALWAKLQTASIHEDPYLDGRILAADVAADYGLAEATLVALLSRATNAGLIEREGRMVQGSRGFRERSWYRARANG